MRLGYRRRELTLRLLRLRRQLPDQRDRLKPHEYAGDAYDPVHPGEASHSGVWFLKLKAHNGEKECAQENELPAYNLESS